MKTKIRLRIERGNEYIEIPFTIKEISNVFDMCAYLLDENDMKVNKIDVGKLFEKFNHIVNDIIHDGVCYSIEGKGDKIRFRKEKDKHYFKKPKWRVKS